MENIPNFENREREAEIDKLIGELAEKEEMNPEDVLSDIITFAPVEGNEDPNLEYLDMVAEKIGISHEEMREYAVKKWEEAQNEHE